MEERVGREKEDREKGGSGRRGKGGGEGWGRKWGGKEGEEGGQKGVRGEE